MRSTNPARGIPGGTAAEGSYSVNPLPLHDLARLTREMGSFVGEGGERAKERDREATKHNQLLRERGVAVPEVGGACDATPLVFTGEQTKSSSAVWGYSMMVEPVEQSRGGRVTS